MSKGVLLGIDQLLAKANSLEIKEPAPEQEEEEDFEAFAENLVLRHKHAKPAHTNLARKFKVTVSIPFEDVPKSTSKPLKKSFALSETYTPTKKTLSYPSRPLTPPLPPPTKIVRRGLPSHVATTSGWTISLKLLEGLFAALLFLFKYAFKGLYLLLKYMYHYSQKSF